MISPELLRRYPFFGLLEDDQLKKIAMISEEESYDKGYTLFHEGKPADALYMLIGGSVDLIYLVEEEYHPELKKEFFVGEINPGEPFGISAIIEPYILTSTARTSEPARLIHIDGVALRRLIDEDQKLSCVLMRQAARVAIERLNFTRVLLAAAGK
jgi:CRP-like cAMP-binding protein